MEQINYWLREPKEKEAKVLEWTITPPPEQEYGIQEIRFFLPQEFTGKRVKVRIEEVV